MVASAQPDESAVDTVLRGYLRVTKAIVLIVSIAVLVLMVGLNGLEIVGRGMFNRSFTWVQEVSILAAMWVYFFAYGLVAKDEEYIRVDFAVNLMGEGARRQIGLVARLLTILFHALVFWLAIEIHRMQSLFTTSVLEWPESLFTVPIILGAADIAITECIYLYWQLAGRVVEHAPVEIIAEAD